MDHEIGTEKNGKTSNTTAKPSTPTARVPTNHEQNGKNENKSQAKRNEAAEKSKKAPVAGVSGTSNKAEKTNNNNGNGKQMHQQTKRGRGTRGRGTRRPGQHTAMHSGSYRPKDKDASSSTGGVTTTPSTTQPEPSQPNPSSPEIPGIQTGEKSQSQSQPLVQPQPTQEVPKQHVPVSPPIVKSDETETEERFENGSYTDYNEYGQDGSYPSEYEQEYFPDSLQYPPQQNPQYGYSYPHPHYQHIPPQYQYQYPVYGQYQPQPGVPAQPQKVGASSSGSQSPIPPPTQPNHPAQMYQQSAYHTPPTAGASSNVHMYYYPHVPSPPAPYPTAGPVIPANSYGGHAPTAQVYPHMQGGHHPSAYMAVTPMYKSSPPSYGYGYPAQPNHRNQPYSIQQGMPIGTYYPQAGEWSGHAHPRLLPNSSPIPYAKKNRANFTQPLIQEPIRPSNGVKQPTLTTEKQQAVLASDKNGEKQLAEPAPLAQKAPVAVSADATTKNTNEEPKQIVEPTVSATPADTPALKTSVTSPPAVSTKPSEEATNTQTLTRSNGPKNSSPGSRRNAQNANSSSLTNSNPRKRSKAAGEWVPKKKNTEQQQQQQQQQPQQQQQQQQEQVAPVPVPTKTTTPVMTTKVLVKSPIAKQAPTSTAQPSVNPVRPIIPPGNPKSEKIQTKRSDVKTLSNGADGMRRKNSEVWGNKATLLQSFIRAYYARLHLVELKNEQQLAHEL